MMPCAMTQEPDPSDVSLPDPAVPGTEVPARNGPAPVVPPIKLPNPPEEKQPEIPKVGSRDAPGG